MAYNDRAMMTDMLSTQKFIASNYNNYAGECSTKRARGKLMKILSEEHEIQFRIFENMQAKGWYETTPAPKDKINRTVQTHITAATIVEKDKKQPAKVSKKSK